MYAEERQQAIVEQARAAGRVEVSALAQQFEVTPETIRRDLTALERHNLLHRVHGGAIPVDRLGFEPGVADRDAVMTAEKDRIAKAALDEVPHEGSIILDAGTTTIRLAKALPTEAELTVVTNGLPIAVALAARPNINVLLLGGRVRGRTMAAVDTWAQRLLAETYVDVAFVGTNGLSAARGLTTPDPTEAAAKKAMVGAARRTVVLAFFDAEEGGLSGARAFVEAAGEQIREEVALNLNLDMVSRNEPTRMDVYGNTSSPELDELNAKHARTSRFR